MLDDCILLEDVGAREYGTSGGMFYGCSSLTEVPDGLFAHCPRIKHFLYTFKDCSKLTRIGKDAFKGCVNATNLKCTFEACSLLTTIEEGLFDDLINVTDIAYCFSRCSNINHVCNLTSPGKKKLWERDGDSDGAKITSFSSFVSSTSSIFRSNIPISWGGSLYLQKLVIEYVVNNQHVNDAVIKVGGTTLTNVGNGLYNGAISSTTQSQSLMINSVQEKTLQLNGLDYNYDLISKDSTTYPKLWDGMTFNDDEDVWTEIENVNGKYIKVLKREARSSFKVFPKYTVEAYRISKNNFVTHTTTGDAYGYLCKLNYLTYVDKDLLIHVGENIINLTCVINGCPKINSLPHGLLDYCSNVESFYAAFYGTPITTIPEGFFDHCR